MVRLKAADVLEEKIQKGNFNSNMVRLKGEQTNKSDELPQIISIPIWFD